MGRLAGIAVVALAAGACTPTAQQRRVRDYNEDGIQLFHRGCYGDARDSFRAALALKPDDADLLYNLGQCHERLGQPDRAAQAYQECLGRAPNHPECRHALTVLLVNGNKREEATRRVEEWLRKEPKLAGPYAEDGWLRAQEGDLVNARGRYQQALALEPANNRALVELADLYERLDRPAYALVLYERALEVNPNQPAVTAARDRLRSRGIGRPHPD
jgi:tetratricopeptide (TPR) repeat protein